MSANLSTRIILILLAANLLMGLARIAMLPAFEGYDETAHYSRLEAEAFAPPGTPNAFISKDVENYYRHGPMSPRWIFARDFNNAYHAALKNGTPFDLAAQEKKENGYTDYRDFFAKPPLVNDYARLYRVQPAPASFTASQTANWQYQHPPFYYVLFSKVLRAAQDQPLLQRLLILRILSYLTAFAGFAIGLFATLRHLELRNNRAARAIAALCAFYPFVMPVYFDEFARLGNDSLCALLFGINWALILWYLRQPKEAFIWVLMGVTMGLSYMTKMVMLPADIGFVLFMLLQPAKGLDRLKPAATAGAIAAAIGYLSTANGGFSGSIELQAWLHGQGFVKGDGLPWSEIFFNVRTMLTSMVYNFSDMAMFGTGDVAVGAIFIALLLILAKWALAQPRDPRREEWLPIYPLILLMAGLFLHAVLGAIAYHADHVAVTPSRYIHVAAPALMLIFGAGMYRLLPLRVGKAFCGALLIVGVLFNTVIMALRLAFFTGCAWIGPNYTGLKLDLGADACKSGTIYDRLAILGWPDFGMICVSASLLLLIGATAATIRHFKNLNDM